MMAWIVIDSKNRDLFLTFYTFAAYEKPHTVFEHRMFCKSAVKFEDKSVAQAVANLSGGNIKRVD